MSYLFFFAMAALASTLLTPIIKNFSTRRGILDIPNHPRKIHAHPMPFLGGVAVFVAFALVLLIYLQFGRPNFAVVPLKFFLATLAGGAVLVLGGAFDDKYNLPPRVLWLFPALAALIVVVSGIGVGITFLSNPFGAPISLKYTIFGIPLSGLFIWVWIMGMTFTTKFLDGLDGLCAGISAIGGLTLFALSLTPKVNQDITATMAIIFSGSLLGYLLYAFHPASIFLGEGGSTFCGFLLGVLSVILGGKIATALLVMGIPILDVAWVIVRRLWYKNSPFIGDRKHLHFRLLDIGLSHRQTVLTLYVISALFGAVAVFLQSLGKLIALIILFLVMLAIAMSVVMLYKRRHPHIPEKNI